MFVGVSHRDKQYRQYIWLLVNNSSIIWLAFSWWGWYTLEIRLIGLFFLTCRLDWIICGLRISSTLEYMNFNLYSANYLLISSANNYNICENLKILISIRLQVSILCQWFSPFLWYPAIPVCRLLCRRLCCCWCWWLNKLCKCVVKFCVTCDGWRVSFMAFPFPLISSHF